MGVSGPIRCAPGAFSSATGGQFNCSAESKQTLQNLRLAEHFTNIDPEVYADTISDAAYIAAFRDLGENTIESFRSDRSQSKIVINDQETIHHR